MDLTELFIKQALSACLILSLSGCSGWFRPREIASLPPAPHEAPRIVEEDKSPRNIGSIWSEGSSWNELYSGKASRVLGDLVLLTPTDSFRIAVAEKRQKNAVQILNSDRDNSHIVGKVIEVLPHGVYRVEGRQGISASNHSYPVRVVAKLREQDISPDDTCSTDALFEMNMEVEPDATPEKNIAGEVTKKSPPKLNATGEVPEKVATQEKEEIPQ